MFFRTKLLKEISHSIVAIYLTLLINSSISTDVLKNASHRPIESKVTETVESVVTETTKEETSAEITKAVVFPEFDETKFGCTTGNSKHLPFQVAVYLSSSDDITNNFANYLENKNSISKRKLCVGVILKSRLVLISQSCIQDFRGRLVEDVHIVAGGDFKLTTANSQVIKGEICANTKSIEVGPDKTDKNWRFFHDYALIYLAKSLNFDDNIRPVGRLFKNKQMSKNNPDCQLLEFNLENSETPAKGDPRINTKVALDLDKQCNCKQGAPSNSKLFCTSSASKHIKHDRFFILPIIKNIFCGACPVCRPQSCPTRPPCPTRPQSCPTRPPCPTCHTCPTSRPCPTSPPCPTKTPEQQTIPRPSFQNGILVCPEKYDKCSDGKRWYALGTYSYTCDSNSYYTNLFGEIDLFEDLMKRCLRKPEV